MVQDYWIEPKSQGAQFTECATPVCDNGVLQDRDFTIEKLVYGGDGLARTGHGVVLTPFVLPGERVRARVTQEKNGLLRGKVIQLLEPSPLRLAPDCPYYSRCGGCHYQHMPYAEQLSQKREILRETFRRIGKIEPSGEIATLSAHPWHYRNRVQLHIETGRLGYFASGTRELCEVESCPVASLRLEEAIRVIHAALPKLGSFSARIELFTNETDLQVNLLDPVPGEARAFFDTLGVTSAIEYHGLRTGPKSFFQVNRFLIEPLVAAAIEDGSGDSALDLYAGVGLFSAVLGRGFGEVTSVEAGASSYRDLVHNSARAAKPWRTINAQVEDFLPTVGDAPDLILCDPPRSGLGKHVTSELLRIRAPRLTIISCDPSTLARDLAALTPGDYQIQKLTLVDLFPQTFHIETLVHLAAV